MKKFKNTSEVEPYDGIIGQERAVSAMQLGLQMNNPAYNIYVSGYCGSGRPQSKRRYSFQRSS